MYTFVTFYTALSSETRHRLERITNSFRVKNNAACWIDLLFRSARYFHPGCRCVLLSDETTPLSPPNYVEILRRPVLKDDPLWSRWQAERELLSQIEEGTHIAFLDFDVLVNASLDQVFRDPFDIALTYRRYREMPINAGVKLVKAGGHQKALQFFNTFLSVFEQHFRHDLWYGEQFALAATIGEAAFEDPPPAYIVVEGTQVRMLPCAQYNYSPPNAARLLRLPADIALLHFKGKRKPLMRKYWHAHYLQREQPHQIRSHFLAIGARLSLAISAVTARQREEE